MQGGNWPVFSFAGKPLCFKPVAGSYRKPAEGTQQCGNMGRISGTFLNRPQSPQELKAVLAHTTSELVVRSCLPSLCILYLRPLNQLPVILLKPLFRRLSAGTSPCLAIKLSFRTISIVDALDITELFYLVSDK